jgi:tetratricopeptide (TPR) repeat protein
MVAAVNQIPNSGSDDILGFVSLGLVMVVLPLRLWLRGRSRRRRAALRAEVAARSAELAEVWRLMRQGRYPEAEQKSLAVQAQCQPRRAADQQIILAAGWCLANVRLARGRMAEAETDFAALLVHYGPERYPDRPYAWLAAAGFGALLVTRGRYADGIARAGRVLEECERRWGAESETTISARAQLGWCLYEGDRPAEAVPVLTQTVAISSRVHGADHAATWGVRHSLAEAQLCLGQLDPAERELRAVLAEYERQQENQPSASGARFGLAKIAALRGQREHAVKGFTQVLTEVRATAGDDGPWTLETRFELASLEAMSGNTADALAHHQAVLADRTRVLGPQHPDTVASRAAVAHCAG